MAQLQFAVSPPRRPPPTTMLFGEEPMPLAPGLAISLYSAPPDRRGRAATVQLCLMEMDGWRVVHLVGDVPATRRPYVPFQAADGSTLSADRGGMRRHQWRIRSVAGGAVLEEIQS